MLKKCLITRNVRWILSLLFWRASYTPGFSPDSPVFSLVSRKCSGLACVHYFFKYLKKCAIVTYSVFCSSFNNNNRVSWMNDIWSPERRRLYASVVRETLNIIFKCRVKYAEFYNNQIKTKILNEIWKI